MGTETGAEGGPDTAPVSPYQLQNGNGSGNGNPSPPVQPSETPRRENLEQEAASEGMDVSLSEVLGCASSYHAMVTPVSLTMVLAALAVVFINTEETIARGEQELHVYQVWKSDSTQRANQSTGKNLAMSLGNTLVMVTFIATMTFGIVLLYKYRCMKCLVGYMIFSSATLLGVLGGTVLDTAINIYRIPVDNFTFFFCLYNFAIVGVISVFFGLGIPTKVTQGYLVCTSVILAWQLSHFDAWTAWTLLVMLALYDLCAVLTPCGPLKALVGLMQQEDAPEMPGLLYEAQLPAGAERRVRRTDTNNNNTSASNSTSPPTTAPTGTTTYSATANSSALHPNASNVSATSASTSTSISRSEPDSAAPSSPSRSNQNNYDASPTPASPVALTSPTAPIDPERIVIIPFAIARVYRLPLLSSLQDPTGSLNDNNNTPLLEEQTHTPSELKAMVEVVMPTPGGRIVRAGNKYQVYDRDGVMRRTLLVNQQGKVMQELDPDDDDDDEYRMSNSIKLGLGDFIFYSVLVSKAAMHSFTTFAACMLVILTGMGATLILLSVFKAALPALPISIFLGVTFYLLTMLVIEPWIQAIYRLPFYV